MVCNVIHQLPVFFSVWSTPHAKYFYISKKVGALFERCMYFFFNQGSWSPWCVQLHPWWSAYHIRFFRWMRRLCKFISLTGLPKVLRVCLWYCKAWHIWLTTSLVVNYRAHRLHLHFHFPVPTVHTERILNEWGTGSYLLRDWNKVTNAF